MALPEISHDRFWCTRLSHLAEWHLFAEVIKSHCLTKGFSFSSLQFSRPCICTDLTQQHSILGICYLFSDSGLRFLSFLLFAQEWLLPRFWLWVWRSLSHHKRTHLCPPILPQQLGYLGNLVPLLARLTHKLTFSPLYIVTFPGKVAIWQSGKAFE